MKTKKLVKKCEKLWKEIVKSRASYKCELCPNSRENGKQMSAHHIEAKKSYYMRLLLDNGICLCSYHHALSSQFSAHKTGIEFTYWLEKKKGREYIDELRSKSRKRNVTSIQEWHNKLKGEIV